MKLKPCPFCGSEKLYIYVFSEGIRCDNCGAKIIDKEDAIDRWNRRVGHGNQNED